LRLVDGAPVAGLAPFRVKTRPKATHSIIIGKWCPGLAGPDSPLTGDGRPGASRQWLPSHS